jgi:hypothetical protein
VPLAFERHYIAEAWHCMPADVDEADENDVLLQQVKMGVDRFVRGQH